MAQYGYVFDRSAGGNLLACWIDLYQDVIKGHPILLESNLMQIYGNFEGFPEKNNALFGLVI